MGIHFASIRPGQAGKILGLRYLDRDGSGIAELYLYVDYHGTKMAVPYIRGSYAFVSEKDVLAGRLPPMLPPEQYEPKEMTIIC